MADVTQLYGTTADELRSIVDEATSQEHPVSGFVLMVEHEQPDGDRPVTSWRNWKGRTHLVGALFVEILQNAIREMSSAALLEKLGDDPPDSEA